MENKRLRSSIIIEEVDDGFVAVDSKIDEQRCNCIVKLNNTSKAIVELLKDGLDLDEIVLKLTERFEVSEDKAKNDVKTIIEKLESIGYFEN